MEWDDYEEECDVCHKDFKIKDLQIAYIESHVCEGCLDSKTNAEIAIELTKSVYPSSAAEILDTLNDQYDEHRKIVKVSA